MSTDSADLCGRCAHYLYAQVETVLTSAGGVHIICMHQVGTVLTSVGGVHITCMHEHGLC